MKLFHFDPNNYEKAVYNYCLKEAENDKQWALNKEKELNGREWTEACQVSQEMLKERLSKSVEDLAIYNYKYLRLRSHSFGGYSAFPIDPQAYELWTKLTGINPKNNK